MTVAIAALVASIAGFISLSYEIMWFRVYSFLTGGSPVTFGLLLGIYLAGLAVGADAAGRMCRGHELRSVYRGRAFLIGFAFLANVSAFLVIPLMGYSTLAPSRRWLALFAVFLSASMFGALLPILSHLGIDARNKAGRNLSYIYFANIIGSVTGSVVTGFVLTDLIPTRAIALVLSLCGIGLVGLLAMHGSFPNRLGRLLLLSASAVAFIIATPILFDRLYEKLLFKDAYHGQRFAHTVENRHDVIAVTDSGATIAGGVYDGHVTTGLVDDRNGIFRAYAVSGFHPHPRKVLMIGMSTGAWAQVIANSPLVDSLTIVEINPGYLDLIRQYPSVAPILANPKVRIVIDDGRRWLVRNPDRRFDFVVSNTTFHFRANATNLLSIEFMRLVHAHLLPGGMFTFNTTLSQDAMRTAFTEFPHGVRIWNFVTVSDSPVVLDADRWRSILAAYRIDGRAVFQLDSRVERQRFEEVAALPQTISQPPTERGLETRESVLSRIPRSVVITDDNMMSEWRTLLLPSVTESRSGAMH